MVTTELKERIRIKLIESKDAFSGSDAKHAVSLGIDKAQYSRIKKGDLEKVLSDANWLSLARRLSVALTNAPEWQTARTPVFEFITAQLKKCQSESLSSMLCDLSDIGKTFTAMHYVKTNKNAIYIDCSQVKTKQKLIRKISREFGLNHTGRYADVYDDLVYYVRSLPDPLIILDEAGDLSYEAFMEIKALWNATDMCCGYYMMGADGLKAKIHRSINAQKIGYTEMFSRFGKRYGRVVPPGKDDRNRFLQTTAAMIIKANAPENVDVNVILKKTIGDDELPSLRRIYKEISKAG